MLTALVFPDYINLVVSELTPVILPNENSFSGVMDPTPMNSDTDFMFKFTLDTTRRPIHSSGSVDEVKANNLYIRKGAITCIPRDGEASGQGANIDIKVVCKFTFNSEEARLLQEESQNYDSAKLRCLQGDVIPYLYGLFTNTKLGITCMILQDCGDPSPNAITFEDK